MAEAKKTDAAKPVAAANDVEQNKVLAAIGYLGILFLVPLLAAKDSPYAQFHAKQALNLFVVSLIAGTAASVLMVVLIGLLLVPIVSIASLVLSVMGILNALNGKMEKLPVVGDIQLIK